jgi:hypothetical protein
MIGVRKMEKANEEDRGCRCKIKDRRQADERRLGQSQDSKLWYEDLRERLNRWKHVCVMCHSRGKNSAHTINRCPLEDSMKAERERARVQRAIKFPQLQVCFKCGVPRLICERWSSDGRARIHDEDGKGAECQFYGVLLGVVYGVKHAYPEVWKRWFDIAKRDVQWKGNMVEFLGTAMEGDEGLGCQVGRAFMYCTEDI